MATSFQPEQPHEPAGNSKGNGSIFLTAFLVAGGIIMLMAVGAPRLFGEDTVDWLWVFGAGVVAFAVIVGLGFAMRSGNRTTT